MDVLKSHILFMACWIRHILPLLDNSKKDELIQTVLCKVKHTSLFDTMAILSAVVASFGFAPVCNQESGLSFLDVLVVHISPYMFYC